MVSQPADSPCEPLLLKSTVEFLIAKWDPFEPFPVLLTTLTLEFLMVATKVPVNPERL